MKQWIRFLAITAALVLTLCVTAMAADTASTAGDVPPSVMVNGEVVDFPDAAPQIVDGRTFIPLRAVFNVLGFADDNITWDGETRTATAVKDDLTITLTEGENTVTVTRGEETETQETDAAAYVNPATGSVMVPLRFVAQTLGCNVGWDSNTRTAIIDDTAAILAANTETYDLMDRYMAYSRSFSARNYNVTGDFTMDMTMGQDTVSVTGDYEMLTSATAADFTTNMIFAGQAEDQDMAAMFPNGLDFEMRFDMETGVYYLYSDALNEAAGTGATGVWYQMDLAAMMDQMGAQSGMDYSALMELSQAAQGMTFTEYLETMLASLPLTDASATTSDVLAVINDICADSAFQQSGAAYTSTYALAEGAELTLTLYASGGSVNGYAVAVSMDGLMDVSASMRGTNMTVNMSMNVPTGGEGSAMTMTMEMTGRYVATTSTPLGVPPTGAGVLDLTELMNSYIPVSGDADTSAEG